jgi:hypothetical protein
MAIEVRCECGESFSVEESKAGASLECGACGRQVRVPWAAKGAGELVAQMQAAAGKGIHLSVGLARPKRHAPTGHARAATHVGFKKVMWMPALLFGLVCLAAGVLSVVLAAGRYAALPPLNGEVVRGPDGRSWLLEKDRQDTVWRDGVPYSIVAGFEIRGQSPDDERSDFAEYLSARGRANGYLLFGIAFLVIGPVLLVLAFWMRRDVRLVAALAAT